MNATEVIRDAVRRMQAEESHVTAWRATIAKGDAQLNCGEGASYTPELMESITLGHRRPAQRLAD